MNPPTDKTIEIECGDCSEPHMETGVQAMSRHIRSAHPEYNEHEADVFALEWMEIAYDRYDRDQEAYAEDQGYERKLNKLRGKP